MREGSILVTLLFGILWPFGGFIYCIFKWYHLRKYFPKIGFWRSLFLRTNLMVIKQVKEFKEEEK